MMDTSVVAAPRALLVELFVEELPPKSLKKLGEAFSDGLRRALAAQGLCAAEAPLQGFATPRRLAARIGEVSARAADRALSVKLMPVSVGLDAAGQPTAALLKKLAALGADASAVPGLRQVPDGKAAALFLDTVQPGVGLAAGLQQALQEAMAALPIAKVMRYQLDDGWTSVDFVRPVHGLVALHGSEVVPVAVLGLAAGRETAGHRFEARAARLPMATAADYEHVLLEQGGVIASFAQRRAEVVRQLREAAGREGLQPVEDEALLDEVTALVERPNVLTCRFEEQFLAVPQECLILTMKANQKYFPLLDAAGRLTNRFLVVSNVRPADPSRVVMGNERVVRPRLADAKFFFDQDRRRTLASRVPELGRVVYHGKLGTQAERVQRVRALAHSIGQQLGGLALADLAEEAATLAKADLLTDMVGEFPELQGIMGAYYARHDGLREAVADAIEDHYKPRFAGDALPRGEVGVVVALADKLETLAGLFGIGQLPSGEKDPFALRRHALGVVRMLVERALPLAVPALVHQAFAAFPAGHGAAQAEVLRFLDDRLAGWLREQGYSAREVDAVLALRPDVWAGLPARLAAVRAFASLPEAPALAAANKRVGNILRKSEDSADVEAGVEASRLVEPAEQALWAALVETTPRAEAARAAGDLTASLQMLAALKAPVDAFFDGVMVNAEDAALRRNRLALLRALHAAMNQVADLARLAG
ncbi:MAG: glycyl-tRNA synthetase subunit beta [Pseudomonadota bacterium]|jgi:glycyl-tRNA synthetase beta chain